jgi:hypothetical protein
VSLQGFFFLYTYCPTRSILEFQLVWNSGKSQLARWNTKWLYYQSASQPAHKIWHIPPHKLWHIPLVGSYPNFNHKLMRPNKSKRQPNTKEDINYYFRKLRRPPMEDKLKIINVEYLSNHLLDHTQVLNLCLDDQIIFYKYFNWRWLPMEDNLKILKVEYISATTYWIMLKF